jgi:Ala-tRNA(Pro) deacylase
MRKKIFDILNSLKIDYKNYEHKPVFTCDETKWIEIPWERVKSLLIRNKKSTNFYMVVLRDCTRLNTNFIRSYFWDTKISFVNKEKMMEKIWLKPGSVSPFALINNQEKDIKVIFENNLNNRKIWLHPLQNDNTVVLDINDIKKFLENIWIEYHFLNL